MKRLFDIFFSLIGLVICFPLFIVISILIKLDSKGPVFFIQERIGRNLKPFKVYKFRTMKHATTEKGPRITVASDKRITRIGKFLRKYKIDELPQLFNVLKGEMSFVGPRPEVKEYVKLYKSEYEKLLKMRPGITDPASIVYSDEEVLLSLTESWEEEYKKRILPEKIALSLSYAENHNIITDLKLIIKTIFKAVGLRIS